MKWNISVAYVLQSWREHFSALLLWKKIQKKFAGLSWQKNQMD